MPRGSSAGLPGAFAARLKAPKTLTPGHGNSSVSTPSASVKGEGAAAHAPKLNSPGGQRESEG